MPHLAQVLGGILAGGVLYVIASGAAGFDVAKGFASNGYGAHSPGGYTLLATLVCEVVMTAFFLFIIMGATDKRAPAGLAPIAIGLCLTLIHLISIPVTNTSVNPARSTGVAIYVGDGPCSSCGCSGWHRSSAASWVRWPIARSARRSDSPVFADLMRAEGRAGPPLSPLSAGRRRPSRA